MLSDPNPQQQNKEALKFIKFFELIKFIELVIICTVGSLIRVKFVERSIILLGFQVDSRRDLLILNMYCLAGI
jgi:hypothetical protein